MPDLTEQQEALRRALRLLDTLSHPSCYGKAELHQAMKDAWAWRDDVLEHGLLDGHEYWTPRTCNCQHRAGCVVCDGGLSICRVCGLSEGSLTSECPGTFVHAEKQDAVYQGLLDFRAGQWVNEISPHCPKGWQQIAMQRGAEA